MSERYTAEILEEKGEFVRLHIRNLMEQSLRRQNPKIHSLPNELSVYWQQYPWVLGTGVCKLRALVSEMSSYVSVLTIVAFSLERYLAICYPIYSYTMKGLHSALGIIAVLWMVAFVSAVPFAYYTTVDYVEYPPGSGAPLEESAFCAMLLHNLPPGYPLCELSSVFFFVLPMTVMLVIYTRMARVIWRPRAVPRGSVRKDHNRKPIVRMLAAVVVAFFISWAPFHLQRLLYIYGGSASNFEEINEVMYYVTGCFYYFSATINPILYNVMSAKYRNAFLQTLCCRQRTRTGARGEQSSFRENTVVGYDGSVTRASTTRYSVYRGSAVAGDRGSLTALASGGVGGGGGGGTALLPVAANGNGAGAGRRLSWRRDVAATAAANGPTCDVDKRALVAEAETCI